MIRSGFVRFNGLRGAPNETLEPPKQSRAKQNETNKKKHAPSCPSRGGFPFGVVRDGLQQCAVRVS